MVISALHLSMKIKYSRSSWGLHFFLFVFCVLSFVSLLHCCFVICIVTFFSPLPSPILSASLLFFTCHFLYVVVLFLLVVTVILVHFITLLFMFISLHSYFCSFHLALAFIHFDTLLKNSSWYVLLCYVLFLFVSLHPHSFILSSCFYKVIRNDNMCPFCIGCQLTSIQMCQFHSSSQTLTFCFDDDYVFGQLLAIKFFLSFDHKSSI
jgi:hypothetical protein